MWCGRGRGKGATGQGRVDGVRGCSVTNEASRFFVHVQDALELGYGRAG